MVISQLRMRHTALIIMTSLQLKSFGEARIEHLLSNSAPFSENTEATLAALNEQEKTICLIDRLRIIYSRFMDAHRKFNIISAIPSCIQDSS